MIIKSEKVKNAVALSFTLIMAVLWVIIVFVSGNKYLTYASVLTCAIFALINFSKEKSVVFQILAFAFTLVADFFLMILEGSYKTVAMSTFLIAQIFYALKILLYARSKAEKRLQIVLRGTLSVIGGLAVFIVLRENTEALFVISVIYYINLILSAVFAYIHFDKGCEQKLTAIGLTLFALCDITIGFDFLIDIFSLGKTSVLYKINHLKISLVHVFYYPSQTLLSLSVLKSK
ncbi:MAG: hypothetical protein IJA97_01270 [Clostridia bacterium]|nr:hypothetical protein [Clostridia bacterium]